MAAYDRQPNETSRAYAAFTAYYLLPARERSIDTAYRRANPDHNLIRKRAVSQWFGWSTQHNWVARAAAYDEHLAEQDRLRWEERRAELREQDWRQGGEVRRIIDESLPEAYRFVKENRTVRHGRDGAPTEVTITLAFDITNLTLALEKASKLQRSATSDESSDDLSLSGAALDAFISSQLARLTHAREASLRPASDADGAETDGVSAEDL